MTLWSGRFSTAMDATLWNLSESFSFDAVLWRHDIIGSIGHVTGLAAAGLVTAEEADALIQTLEHVADEFAADAFVRAPHDEDVHMAIERRVTELLGPVGARLHTGRSRNDQVATTLRLFTRDALEEVAIRVADLIASLQRVAIRYDDAVLPGYTHLQRAQAVPLSHHVNAHAVALTRDLSRLADASNRLNVSPLGAGALAGSTLPLRPDVTSEALGFAEPFVNSLDAVSDRDFVAETLFVLSLIAVHCSRMGEELVLWTSAEFNFAHLGDDFTTGSSMLPQKKNADVAELARGKSGRVVGNLVAVLTMLKGLPLSYNRDLQEDTEPLFDSLTTITLVLRALSGSYDSLMWHDDVTRHAASDEMMLAIDLADWLVQRGTPFREAHEHVGRLVATAVAQRITLSEAAAGSEFWSGSEEIFVPLSSLRRRVSAGGASFESQANTSKWLENQVASHLSRLRARGVTRPATM